MKTKNYVKWLRTMLISNLPARSVLVIGSAFYHNIQMDKPPPTSSSLNLYIVL